MIIYLKHCSHKFLKGTNHGRSWDILQPSYIIAKNSGSLLRTHSKKCGKGETACKQVLPYFLENPIQLVQIHLATPHKLQEIPPRNLLDVRKPPKGKAGKPRVSPRHHNTWVQKRISRMWKHLLALLWKQAVIPKCLCAFLQITYIFKMSFSIPDLTYTQTHTQRDHQNVEACGFLELCNSRKTRLTQRCGSKGSTQDKSGTWSWLLLKIEHNVQQSCKGQWPGAHPAEAHPCALASWHTAWEVLDVMSPRSH